MKNAIMHELRCFFSIFKHVFIFVTSAFISMPALSNILYGNDEIFKHQSMLTKQDLIIAMSKSNLVLNEAKTSIIEIYVNTENPSLPLNLIVESINLKDQEGMPLPIDIKISEFQNQVAIYTETLEEGFTYASKSALKAKPLTSLPTKENHSAMFVIELTPERQSIYPGNYETIAFVNVTQ